jgi:hypothetical protein
MSLKGLVREFAVGLAVFVGLAMVQIPAYASVSHGLSRSNEHLEGQEGRATGLLNQVRTEAYKVQSEAGQLLAYDPLLIGWQAYSSELTRIKGHVDAMDSKVTHLREMEAKLAPQQRTEIQRIAPRALVLTLDTDGAIKAVSRHQQDIFASQFDVYAQQLYTQAKQINGVTSDYASMARLGNELHQVRENLKPTVRS